MSAQFLRALVISLPEFLVLWVLWMAFVSNPHPSEMLAGLGAALIAALADAVVKSRKLVQFFTHIKWIALVLLEPWYVLEGTWMIFLALGKRIIGRPSEAQLKAMRFDSGGDDETSQARRALALAYSTISPTSVVLGIDRRRELMLVHEISPMRVPLITKKLGARE